MFLWHERNIGPLQLVIFRGRPRTILQLVEHFPRDFEDFLWRVVQITIALSLSERTVEYFWIIGRIRKLSKKPAESVTFSCCC